MAQGNAYLRRRKAHLMALGAMLERRRPIYGILGTRSAHSEETMR